MTTQEEILDTAKKLVGLLEHPEPGLFTWHEFRAETAKKLYSQLGDVLGHPPRS